VRVGSDREWWRVECERECGRDWWRAGCERESDREWWRAQVESCGGRRGRRRGEGSPPRGRWVVFQ
jgi:hypothetical protein